MRPLLPFWRADLEAFAREHGIPFRDDPTNRDPRWTRNRLRHHVLPALEEAVPGAARALAALADTAAAGKTRAPPARRPSATMKPTEAGSSTTGSVSGMQQTAV